ncbi:MAG TPA: YqgE/AlgH family protein, partial [Bryobacteraceae bacterium]|nr:YqgE/AlgH family protein [Bryobacteraceae bacterium]
ELGAVGLVLNRPTEKTVSQLLQGVEEAGKRKDAVFSGGPVQPDSILALLRSSAAKQGAKHLSGDVYAILDENLMKQTLKDGAGPDALRFYSGYAGWGPGQLEAEVGAGAWHVASGDADTVFSANPKSLWDRLIRDADGTLVERRQRRASPPDPALHLVLLMLPGRR